MQTSSPCFSSWALRCIQLVATVLGLGGAAAAPGPGSDGARVPGFSAPGAGHLVLDVQNVPPPVPVFFSAAVEASLRVEPSEVSGEARIKLHILQGRPEVLTLGLAGDGDVIEVSGNGLRDWSVRQVALVNPSLRSQSQKLPRTGDTQRLLDLRPVLVAGTEIKDLEVVVRTRVRKPAIPGAMTPLLIAPGDAVGFASKLSLQGGASLDVRISTIVGWVRMGETTEPGEPIRFVSSGDGRIELMVTPRGAAVADAELLNAQLTGKLTESGTSVSFRLRGQFRASKPGARIRLLAGNAALSEATAGDGWHVELVRVGAKAYVYELVGDREGIFSLDLPFVAEVRDAGDWRTVDFTMPAGAIVPVQLDGLGAGVRFRAESPIVPVEKGQSWHGFLPPNGRASLAWKRTQAAAEAALFFTSNEESDVRLGAGVMRETTRLSLRVLQGKLKGLRCRLEGSGEILGVEGVAPFSSILGWKVTPDGDARVLEVQFSRPMETEGALVIRSQAELSGIPIRAEPLRLAPQGVVRHSGFLRVANDGAVRLEVVDALGMMQLAPVQYPGEPVEPGARQVFVYRFPSADYSYRVVASQIQPEVSVSQVAVYQLGETDRVINADLELDVREAPLRDWSFLIPDDYTVAAANGSDVSDYAVESESVGGYRALKFIFEKSVEGRRLLRVRLEKNQPAAAGEWLLRSLKFPGAKSVRGNVGVVSAPGYRIVPAQTDRLVEVPLSYFPTKTAGLQQAWRVRESDWTARVGIEALGQSVQADVFHLYSIKEGVVYGSVLVNYFVVGAPATEWRVEVPSSIGNIDVVGQNVRRDWRREGNQVVVALHQPVLGAATLLLTFEEPMSARGGTISPGQVRPLGVQSERGFIQVVSPLQVKHEIRSTEGGLLKLEPLELPTEYRLLSSSPSLVAYQYIARPFKLELGVKWYASAETVDQVVDFAKLSSQVSRDGQVITEARYFVKTRGRKALRLLFPQDVKLWEARVDNELVTARTDGDATLIPLPARLNPNDPVAVVLRLGQTAKGAGTALTLLAPRTSAATVINEWTLHSDSGRFLVPRGGSGEWVRPPLTETGFEWLSSRGRMAVFTLISCLALGTLLLRSKSPQGLGRGLLLLVAAVGGALLFAYEANANSRPNLHELTYAATVIPSGQTVALSVDNVGLGRALLVNWGLGLAVLGATVLSVSVLRIRRAAVQAARTGAEAVPVGIDRILPALGLSLLTAGLLAQHGGAVLFFLMSAFAIFALLLIPGFTRWKRERLLVPESPSQSSGAGVLPLLAILGVIGGVALTSPSARADSRPVATTLSRESSVKPAQAIVQSWSIRDNRLYAELEITVRGVSGDSFLLLRAPALLTEFKGEGLRMGKLDQEGEVAYYLSPERDGLLTARARFEMALADLTQPLALPTGPAASQRVSLVLEQGGWEFSSPTAVQIVPTAGLGENRSGATLIFAPHGVSVVQLHPKRRNIAAEATQFFAEAANLYIPGPGVVNGFTRVTVRPVQGRVSELSLEIPKGLTVGDVTRGPVGSWRFDPEKRRLRVSVEPGQTDAFTFDVQTQLGTGVLPFDLSLQPLRVLGSAGEVGLLAIAFGGDAQPESVRVTELSGVNIQDFTTALVPQGPDGQAVATVQQVWRYGQAGGRVDLKIAPVAPEIRVANRHLITLDDDRLVMAVDLNVTISRVGLFKLSFALPAGLEVEAISGPSLSHWTEATEAKERIITLHLNGRTLGEQTFALTLAGAAPSAQEGWLVPRVSLREATRQTGDALIVPGKGLRVRATERERVTQLDPRSIGGLQPGTLAFRLLQEDWVLRVGIEALEPWVTVQSLQEVTFREGQTMTRIGLRYRVENAAMKHLRVKLPGLGDDRARTVRATGAVVSDMVRIPSEPDLWEIRFQRGIAGETDVQIEFQGPATREQDREQVVPIVFVGARQVVQFVAVRAGGRLELEADAVFRGWTRTDWSAVPVNLQDRSDRSVPALCFRVAEPEGALSVRVQRHEVAEALKLRVTRGDLTTLFAPTGASLTAVELKFDVLEKSTLRVRLPEGARLFNTFVNGESVSVVREGDACLFHVAPNSDADRSAIVRVVYSVSPTKTGEIRLIGPSLSVPLENVCWRVVVPAGYDLASYGGALRLREDRADAYFDIEEYKSLVASRRSDEAKKGVALLQEASSWLQKGDQQKASDVLSRASNTRGLDEASNEDARVQLRTLKTQQTVLGLNTRRQRLYLDNRVDAPRNEQLEQAANLNPLMQGKVNFDPQQLDQLLMGNTLEENTALRGIASRLVDQQLTADPAPGAIDVTLPERGRVLTFTRSLQVDGSAPLELTLKVETLARGGYAFGALVLAALAAIALIPFLRRAGNAA